MEMSEEHKKRCAVYAANNFGIELTPDQFEEEFNRAVASIQKGMTEKGYDLSEDRVISIMPLAVQLIKEQDRKARFDARIQEIIDQMKLDRQDKWTVQDGQGGVCKRYDHQWDADDDVDKRNARAKQCGLPACYIVKFCKD